MTPILAIAVFAWSLFGSPDPEPAPSAAPDAEAVAKAAQAAADKAVKELTEKAVKEAAARAAAQAAPVVESEPEPVAEEVTDDSELIAVIAAALAAYTDSDKQLVVRKVRRVSGWNRTARAEQVYRF